MELFKDTWIPKLGKLQEHVLPGADIPFNLKVVDYVDNSGCWNWRILRSIFPYDILEHIRCLHPPRADFGSDSCFWGWASSGHFTLRSAYNSLVPTIGDVEGKTWKVIGTLMHTLQQNKLLAVFLAVFG